MNSKMFLVTVWLACVVWVSGCSVRARSEEGEAPVQVAWELVRNTSAEVPRFQARLVIKNTSEQVLPASGWRLYFNLRYHGYDLKSSSAVAAIRQVSGELFYVVPTASFQPVASGQSFTLDYSGKAPVANYQDVPSGLFLTWDADSTRAIALANPTIDRKDNLPTPDYRGVYDQNKIVRDIPLAELPAVFPTPAALVAKTGTLTLTGDVHITADPAFQHEADFLQEELKAMFNTPAPSPASANAKNISFKKETLPAEAYRLSITPQGITIAAGDGAGAFYGLRSLQSLFPSDIRSTNTSNLTLACAEIKDQPRFPMRAFMLDVARNFQSKEQVLRILDVMSLYKLNVFHFHFSDDEGWRLEIPGLPELTEIGSVRGYPFQNNQRLHPSYGSGATPGKPQGSGHYSREDFLEILRYATRRHIRVIPEIESPGHARAAILSMDARYQKYMQENNRAEAERYLLRDVNDRSVYRSNQYFNDNVMNVALPSTYAFIDKVVTELQRMYKDANAPLTMIHMAGDEVPAGSWEKSPAVAAFQKENASLKTSTDLWRHYFIRMKEILREHGLMLYGWEELVTGVQKSDDSREVLDIPDFKNGNVLVDAWWNAGGHEAMPYQMANKGYDIVLACVDHFYFDMAHAPAFEEPGDAWVGLIDLQKVYSFVPFDYYRNTTTDLAGKPLPNDYFNGKEKLSAAGKAHIKGLQGALWVENLARQELVEYMLLPRLLALAERAWAPEADWEREPNAAKSLALYKTRWSVFMNVLGKKELPRLDVFQGGYAYHIPYPGATVENGSVALNLEVPGFDIRYTTDGSEPVMNSTRYETPIKTKGVVKAKAFNQKGRSSVTLVIENP
ncbi:family 20 glycosylhydrolase [Chryseolinea soli]|nr:family 20 glycosylhydrolase [Chryseolinea soli]